MITGNTSTAGDELLATIEDAAGMILAVSENRVWIEILFEGDLMHSRTINLPGGLGCEIYVENIPHKATIYEHPRTMIFFTGPCAIDVRQTGNRVIVSAAEEGVSA
jgi:hypothetical protein